MKSSLARAQIRLLPILLVGAAACGLIFMVSPEAVGQSSTDSPPKPVKEGKVKKNWSDLSEEEKQKLREALRTIWSDPRVVSARENVNRSAREYREAVQLTLASLDPEIARLVENMADEPKGPPFPFPNGAAGKGKRPGQSPRDFEHFLNPPPFMEKLTSEQRQLYFKASAKAHNEPRVQAAWEVLRALNREDEEMRRRKFEALLRYRSLYLEAIVRAEPQLADVISLAEKEREKSRTDGRDAPPPR